MWNTSDDARYLHYILRTRSSLSKHINLLKLTQILWFLSHLSSTLPRKRLPKNLISSLHPKSTATMLFTTNLPRIIPSVPSNLTYLFISALTTLTSLTTSLLDRRQYETCKNPQPSSITRILTRYISRSISTSATITCDRSGSSYPLLPPLPSRQPSNLSLNELPPFNPQTALTTHIQLLTTLHPSTLYLGHTTFSQPSTPTLYARRQKHFPCTTTYLGRICHLSPSTNRMTVTLHPEDIDTVVQAGWGQRGSAPNSNKTLLLHAPRNEHDLTILKTILQAAIGYVCSTSTGEVEKGEGGDDVLGLRESESLERPEWLLPRYAL